MCALRRGASDDCPCARADCQLQCSEFRVPNVGSGLRADLRQFDLAAVDLPVEPAFHRGDVWVRLVPAKLTAATDGLPASHRQRQVGTVRSVAQEFHDVPISTAVPRPARASSAAGQPVREHRMRNG